MRRKPNGVVTTVTRYVWGLGLLYEEDDATGETRTYHYDRRGSTVALTKDDGQTVSDQWVYGPYGEALSHSGTSDTPFRFNGFFGVQTDPNGLLYMNARYYNTELRRFISSDPIGFAGGPNLYAYCGGDPIMRTDPTGLWFGADDAIFAGTGAVIGVGGRFIANLVTGSEHHWEDYAGAAAGGIAGGEALLYTANPFIAGAAGGLVSNAATQALKVNVTHTQENWNIPSLAVDTGLGAATGFIPGRPTIAGVNAGRGSDLQVFRQIVTKAQNGTISTIETSTAVRMAQGAYYEYAIGQGATVSAIGSNLLTPLLPSGPSSPESGNK